MNSLPILRNWERQSYAKMRFRPTAARESALLLEDLMMLASAKGIDLRHVAGTASETHKAAKQRVRTQWERALGIPAVALTVEGKSSRVSRKPGISIEDLSLALGGLKGRSLQAMYFSIWGDSSVYGDLVRHLMHEALRLSDAGKWPMRIRRANGALGDAYEHIPRLAELVLDADTHKSYFAVAPGLFPLYLGIPDDIWDRVISHWFRDLSLSYERWISVAFSQAAQNRREMGSVTRNRMDQPDTPFDPTNPAACEIEVAA